MAQGDPWLLPDGRRAVEVGRTARLLRAVPILETAPFMAPSVLVWRADCTPLPARYLHGDIPSAPQPESPA
jgi:hypothetical protein